MSEHDHDGCGCSHNHDECGCGCGHDHDQSTVTLSLEDGSTIECAVIAVFPAGDFKYIALLPIDDIEEDESEVFLYRFIESEEGEIELINIEDDDEYDLVSEAFDALLDDEEFDEFFDEEE